MKYIDADKLIAEFQKRFDICKRISEDDRNALDTQDFYRGKYTSYSECLSFITSHQQQPIPSKSVELEAEAEAKEYSQMLGTLYGYFRKVLDRFGVYSEHEELLESREEWLGEFCSDCADAIFNRIRPLYGMKATATVGYYNQSGLSILTEPSIKKLGFEEGDVLELIIRKK